MSGREIQKQMLKHCDTSSGKCADSSLQALKNRLDK